jgi:hypothetical protein
MKFVVLALLVVSAIAEEISHDPIDISNAVRRSELPGFWEGKDFPTIFQASAGVRSPRIVGGTAVPPHSANYMVRFGISIDSGLMLMILCMFGHEIINLNPFENFGLILEFL